MPPAPAPTPPPEPDPRGEPEPAAPRLAELLGTIGSLLSLFTAVLFYFGWASTDAETRALGLRDTLFRLSTADYLLRSVNALYLPALVGAAAVFGAHAVHRGMRDEPRWAGPLVRGLRWAWVPAVMMVVAYPLAPQVFELVLPLGVMLGALLTAYGRTRAARNARLWALALIVAVIALFWSVYSYAGVVGRGRAAETARTVEGGLPAVVVFSKEDLLIRGGGSCLSLVAEKGSPYRYRYAGLRLFHVSGDRLYLVPRHWAPWDGTLYILEDKNPVLRVEYVSGSRYRSGECP